MSQVSKRLLAKEIENRILNTLWDGVSMVKDSKESQIFLEDLLTPTEKIMLSKRLAISVLLFKNYDYRSICKTLKVSTNTIRNVSIWLKNGGGGYQLITNRLLREEKWIEILDLIDKILYGLPIPRGKKVFLDKPIRKQIKPRTI